MEDYVKFIFDVNCDDYSNAGNVSNTIKKYLLQLGINHKIIRSVTVSAYEAEMNLVIHSLGGAIKLEVTTKEIILIAEDCGPGIPNVHSAMVEGFSTASEKAREMGFGAGMGLPNMKRLSDEFSIKSTVRGTFVKMKYRLFS